MNENPPIVQRITSASQVDAYRGNSIYELITDKNGRRAFVHRDGAEFNRFIKPNCEKHLFYYINTGDLELSYRFDDVYYCSERLSADVIFKVRLCPAVDLEWNPELADWIKGQNCEVLFIENLAKSLNERLKQYFSAILNGATTLALVERYGAGAVSDDKAYWTDAGLPSWLEIVETSSIQATGEARQELIKENDRIARARERQRKLLEQIDIVVTEDKLANVIDEIAHRNEMLRKQRELEIARINRLKREEVLKLELSEIKRDYIEACHDVDYKIKCSDLELKKVQVQEKLRKIENESRESETRVKKLEQEIKESQARIDAIIRPKTWMFLIAWFLFGLMVALGVVSYFFVEHYSEKQKERDIINAERQKKIEEEKLLRERHETEKTARQKAIVASVALKYQTIYDELMNSYRYYGWRTNHFNTAKKLIGELEKLWIQEDKGKISVVTQKLTKVLCEIKAYDECSLKKERMLLNWIEPCICKLDTMLMMLPSDFIWGNISKETFAKWKIELISMHNNISRGGIVAESDVSRLTRLVLKYVEFDYKANAMTWYDKCDISRENDDLYTFFVEEFRKMQSCIIALENKDYNYFKQLMSAIRLHYALKFYNDKGADTLVRINAVHKRMELRTDMSFLAKEVQVLRDDYVEKIKKLVLQRARLKYFIDITNDACSKLDSIQNMFDYHLGETERIRNECLLAYRSRKWDSLMANANSLKMNKKFVVEGEYWETVAKWGMVDSYASNLILRINQKFSDAVSAYLRCDIGFAVNIDKLEFKEDMLSWFSDPNYLRNGPVKENIERIKNSLNVDPLPEINNYLLLREIGTLLGGGSIEDVVWIYDYTTNPSTLFRYFEICRRGICGMKKSNEKAMMVLRRIELLGGESAKAAKKMKMKILGF